MSFDSIGYFLCALFGGNYRLERKLLRWKVCVCVRVRQRERERGKENRSKESSHKRDIYSHVKSRYLRDMGKKVQFVRV